MDSKMVLVCFFSIISAASLLSNGAYAATTYNVGDKLGWSIPPLGDVAYKTWAAQHNFVVGDTLVFNFTAGSHSVAEVNKAAYDACNTQSPISISTSAPTNIKLSSAGEHYYICTFPSHCNVGMKLAINVSATTTTSPTPKPSIAPVSAPTPALSPFRTPVRHVVGDALGWSIPPRGPVTYTNWASQQTFILGDILVFNFTTGFHNVAIVNKASYDACSLQSPNSISPVGPSNIVLTSVGEQYYFCTFASHCTLGMKLAIIVSATATTTPTPQPSKAPVSAPTLAPSSSPSATPSPSPAATPPSGSSTATPSSSPTPPSGSSTATPSSSPTPPSGSSTTTPSSSSTPSATPPAGSVPPSPSSASIVAIAAMPFTLLSIAFTLFY